MKFEITCPKCGNEQIYKPRKGKVPKHPHTDCKKCGANIEIDPKAFSKVPKIPNKNDISCQNLTEQKYSKITEDMLEKAILDWLNKNIPKSKENAIRAAVDFFIKIKNKTDTMDEDLDMEALKKIGIISKDSD